MIRNLARTSLVCLLSFLTLSCSGKAGSEDTMDHQPPAQTRKHRETAILEETDQLPEATAPDGQIFKLELALTREEITNGLMFRPHLEENRGMLFLFKQERTPSFWMKNCLIPLDIIFLDSRGQVVDISAEVLPCSVEPCPQYVPMAPARAVLELNGGAAAAHQIAVGSVLKFQRVPGYPEKKLES